MLYKGYPKTIFHADEIAGTATCIYVGVIVYAILVITRKL